MEEPQPFILMLTLKGTPDSAIESKLSRISKEPIRRLMSGGTMLAVGVNWVGDAGTLFGAVVNAKIAGMAELLIVQPTEDWSGMRDRASTGWMVKHCGNPMHWGVDD